MKKIGLVGVGETVGIAHFHAQGIKNDGRAEISAVYDLNAEAADRFVREHALTAKVCKNYEELLSLADACIICTPNNTHIPYALQTIQANRAVFVEKPLGASPEACLPVLNLLKESPVVNMAGFIYRFANPIREMRKLVREHIGQIYTFSASFGGKRLADPSLPLEWRMRRETSGSGALGDFGSHLVDNAAFVADMEFESLAATTGTFIKERTADSHGRTAVENDDAAVLQGLARNGALASFLVSRVGMDELNLLVSGEGGLARVALCGSEPVRFWPKKSGGAYTGACVEIHAKAQQPFDGWFYEEDTAFISALSGQVSDEIPNLAHACYVERLLWQADKAARTAWE